MMPSRWKSLTTTRRRTLSDQPSPGERIPLSHLGETLREDFLLPIDKDAAWLAEGLHLPLAKVEELLAEQRPITAEIALRLSRLLGTSAGVWMGLQEHFDLETTQERLAPELDDIQPCRMPHLEYGDEGEARGTVWGTELPRTSPETGPIGG
jgi:addiction module HigA family antidote